MIVSIPVWFDWERGHGHIFILPKPVSIPVWFDWESTPMWRGSTDSSFNSSMVRLGVFSLHSSGFTYTRFNSSMVRLGDADAPLFASVKPFQFQYGSIGSLLIKKRKSIYILVSIPVWFDWEPNRDILYPVRLQVSIPVWFDWE